MSKLYDAVMKIDKTIQEKQLQVFEVKGKIGLKAGMVLGMITATSPDDPAVLQKLRQAAKEVLDINL